MAGDLAVIVPAYNEEATVAEIIRRLQAQPVVSQIIIVDDGSTDGTYAAVTPWLNDPQVTILRHEVNRGKGRAIRTGLEKVRCAHVLIQDADLEYSPSDIPRLLTPMSSGQADVVYGSRYLHHPQLAKGRFVLQSGIRCINVLCRILYGVRLTDEATCYKLFRSSDLLRMQLECERFEFCPEVTAKATRLGLRIQEVPINYESRSAEEGKKLRTTDGWCAICTLWRFKRWNSGLADSHHSEQTTHRQFNVIQCKCASPASAVGNTYSQNHSQSTTPQGMVFPTP